MTHQLRGKIQSVVMRAYPDLQLHLQFLGAPLTEIQATTVIQHEQALLETALQMFREAVKSQRVSDRDLADLLESQPDANQPDLFERPA
jgi:hypothetical protein